MVANSPSDFEGFANDSIKVLIVEDEWIVSEELKLILEGFDFEVIGQFDDAESALSLVAGIPDLLFADIQIKGPVDGIELAIQMKSRTNCEVIFISSFHDRRTLKRIREANPLAFVSKPFDSDCIRTALQQFHRFRP